MPGLFLEKNPDARYASAAAMADDLERWLAALNLSWTDLGVALDRAAPGRLAKGAERNATA